MYKKMQKLIAVVLTTILLASPVAAAMPTLPSLPTLPESPDPVTAIVTSTKMPTPSVEPVAPASATQEKTPETTKVELTGTNSTTDSSPEVAGGTQSDPSALGQESQTGETAATNLENSTTGVESENSLLIGGGTDQTLDIANGAEVTNNVTGTADTGNNSASYNTGDGSVESGDANIVLSILNFINTTIVGISPGNVVTFFASVYHDLFGDYIVDPVSGEAYSLSGSRLDVSNTNTGANSTNNALIDTGSDTSLALDNNALVDNNISLTSNTGNNTGSYNTGNGTVRTGDSNISLNLLNFINSSIVASNYGLFGVVNIFGNWVGNLILPDEITGGIGNLAIFLGNTNTGANSTNNATLDSSNTSDTTVNNDLGLTNTINIDNNTGGNASSYNTGDGSVATGDADTRVDVANVGNETVIGDTIFLTIVNLMGKWNGVEMFAPIIIISKNLLSGFMGSGQVVLGNTDTGFGSVNDATLTANSTNTTDITNTASINNSIDISANTGGNTSSYNTGSGSVVTGDSNVLVNLLNFANLNIVASHVVMMVINVFGDWTGEFSNKVIQKEESNHTTSTTGTSTVSVTSKTPENINVSVQPTVQELKTKLFSSGEDNTNGENKSVLSASTNSGGDDGLLAGSENTTVIGEQLNIYWYILVASLILAFAITALRIRRRLELQRNFQGFEGGMKWS